MIAVDFAAPAADDGDGASLDLCGTNKAKRKDTEQKEEKKIVVSHHSCKYTFQFRRGG